ncbi:hypothetical protein BZL30_6711 [Mycobacterium kansasii]|uniref:Uncharacterized protein n=1 Tax=Mycobacterium kansasii TaxID=1768 RepID=A0A1V3WUG7_MYCKA|nr:hypothetical protein BZL30_6711 [Mycobacterium kansasii]
MDVVVGGFDGAVAGAAEGPAPGRGLPENTTTATMTSATTATTARNAATSQTPRADRAGPDGGFGGVVSTSSDGS